LYNRTKFASVTRLFPADSAGDHRKEKHFMLKRFRGFALILAIAMLGVVQPLASAWAGHTDKHCDPCVYAPDVTPERP
jgi:hypothetical protein